MQRLTLQTVLGGFNSRPHFNLSEQGLIMVEGPGALKQVQPLWQDQKQWAFALDIAEGQANVHPSLQLPSIPGQDTGEHCA